MEFYKESSNNFLQKKINGQLKLYQKSHYFGLKHSTKQLNLNSNNSTSHNIRHENDHVWLQTEGCSRVQNSNLSCPFSLGLSFHPHVFCGDSNTLVSVRFTAASLCMQRLPPSYRIRQTCRKVMNGCSQRGGNGISDQKNETDPKCIDLLGQIARWTDSLTDGWLLVGRLSNFPLTLSSLQLCD